MSLINKNSLDNLKPYGLWNFIPESCSYNHVLYYLKNFSLRCRCFYDYDDLNLIEIVDQINVLNLFGFDKTSEGYDFWKEIDNEQYKFINNEKEHFFVDHEWEKLTFDLDENDGFSTYNINSEIIKQILYKFSKK